MAIRRWPRPKLLIELEKAILPTVFPLQECRVSLMGFACIRTQRVGAVGNSSQLTGWARMRLAGVSGASRAG